MTKHAIPDSARAMIKQAADCAYDQIRWAVGDSYEVAATLHRLALEAWREGFRTAQELARKAAE